MIYIMNIPLIETDNKHIEKEVILILATCTFSKNKGANVVIS